VTEQGKNSDRHENVVQKGYDRSHGEGKLETERDKNQDAKNTKTERNEGALRQFTTDKCAYTLGAFHHKTGARHRLNYLFLHFIARVQRGPDRDVTLASLR